MGTTVFSLILLTTGFQAFAFPLASVKEESLTFSYKKGNGSSESETVPVSETIIAKFSFEETTNNSTEAFNSGNLHNTSDLERNPFPATKLELENSEVKSYEIAQTEENPKERKRSLSLEILDEIDEEDVKLLDLEESNEDQPPEGFPLGFFQKNFISLRRLGEPEKSGNNDEIFTQDEITSQSPKPKSTILLVEETVADKPHQLEESRVDALPEGFPNDFFQQYSPGLRRLQDPVKNEGKHHDFGGKADRTNFTEVRLNSDYIVPTGHWRHFTNIPQFPSETLTSGQSGYGYSYEQPNAHGFVYYY